jgi:hypothetical protein
MTRKKLTSVVKLLLAVFAKVVSGVTIKSFNFLSLIASDDEKYVLLMTFDNTPMA